MPNDTIENQLQRVIEHAKQNPGDMERFLKIWQVFRNGQTQNESDLERRVSDLETELNAAKDLVNRRDQVLAARAGADLGEALGKVIGADGPFDCVYQDALQLARDIVGQWGVIGSSVQQAVKNELGRAGVERRLAFNLVNYCVVKKISDVLWADDLEDFDVLLMSLSIREPDSKCYGRTGNIRPTPESFADRLANLKQRVQVLRKQMDEAKLELVPEVIAPFVPEQYEDVFATTFVRKQDDVRSTVWPGLRADTTMKFPARVVVAPVGTLESYWKLVDAQLSAGAE